MGEIGDTADDGCKRVVERNGLHEVPADALVQVDMRFRQFEPVFEFSRLWHALIMAGTKRECGRSTSNNLVCCRTSAQTTIERYRLRKDASHVESPKG